MAVRELFIQTGLRNGKTFLKNSFHTQPFKIADITEDKSEKVLQLMVMNSSPGILDEDEYKINIAVAENSSLQIETQSYQRLFAMKKGASQKTELYMKTGSSFYFLPYPVVPHKGAHFFCSNKIFLSGKCNLIWSEVLTCGRKLSGEIFQFSRYHTVTEIFLNDKLVVKDNLFLEPLTMDVTTIGQLEGYSHQATLLYVNEQVSLKDATSDITGFLEVQPGIDFGISALPVNGFILRILGNGGESLHQYLKNIAKRLMQDTYHRNSIKYAN
jgi:urease accessory protein